MTLSPRHWKEINIFLIFFFGVSLFLYLLLNGGAYMRVLRYSLFLNSPLAGTELTEGNIFDVSSGGILSETKQIQGYHLIIPKISVEAPVAIPRGNDKKTILASLEEGVGLYPGSNGFGNPGRSILLGHSSLASWYRGDYATIFALLPKLEEFDEFYVVGDGKKYVYRVFAKKILTPQETNALLAGPAAESEVNLITCYPIGSASKRNVIQAKLISAEEI